MEFVYSSTELVFLSCLLLVHDIISCWAPINHLKINSYVLLLSYRLGVNLLEYLEFSKIRFHLVPLMASSFPQFFNRMILNGKGCAVSVIGWILVNNNTWNYWIDLLWSKRRRAAFIGICILISLYPVVCRKVGDFLFEFV